MATCPFTGEPCGIREIGDGITVLPGMGLLTRDGVLMKPIVSLLLVLGPADTELYQRVMSIVMEAKACYLSVPQIKGIDLINFNMTMENGVRFVLYVPCSQYDRHFHFYSHHVHAIQRSVRRFTQRRKQARRLAMAQAHTYSPLNQIPIEVFLTHVVWN